MGKEITLDDMLIEHKKRLRFTKYPKKETLDVKNVIDLHKKIIYELNEKLKENKNLFDQSVLDIFVFANEKNNNVCILIQSNNDPDTILYSKFNIRKSKSKIFNPQEHNHSVAMIVASLIEKDNRVTHRIHLTDVAASVIANSGITQKSVTNKNLFVVHNEDQIHNPECDSKNESQLLRLAKKITAYKKYYDDIHIIDSKKSEDLTNRNSIKNRSDIIHLCFFKRHVCEIINNFFSRTNPHDGPYVIVWDSSGSRKNEYSAATYRIYQDVPTNTKTLQICVKMPRLATDYGNMDHLSFAGCLIIAQQLRRHLRRITKKTGKMIVVSDGYAQKGKELDSERFKNQLAILSDVFGDDLDVTHHEIDCIGHTKGYNKNNPCRETREHVICDEYCQEKAYDDNLANAKPIRITIEDNA